MEVTLHIIVKDSDSEKTRLEISHKMKVSADEYDFVLRMLRKSRDFHANQMQKLQYHYKLLRDHAPQFARKVYDECYGAIEANGFDFFYTHTLLHWDEQIMKDSQYCEDELESDEECEALLVTFCGATITDKNIIGCHFRRDFIYETWPGDAGGITNRRGFDCIDCDICGCDLEYWNHQARIARSKPAYFEPLGAKLSVEHLDELGSYCIQEKRYGGDNWRPELLARVMQRSLRIIRKKILKHELERII